MTTSERDGAGASLLGKDQLEKNTESALRTGDWGLARGSTICRRRRRKVGGLVAPSV